MYSTQCSMFTYDILNVCICYPLSVFGIFYFVVHFFSFKMNVYPFSTLYQQKKGLKPSDETCIARQESNTYLDEATEKREKETESSIETNGHRCHSNSKCLHRSYRHLSFLLH